MRTILFLVFLCNKFAKEPKLFSLHERNNVYFQSNKLFEIIKEHNNQHIIKNNCLMAI